MTECCCTKRGLGIGCDLNLNFLPQSLFLSNSSMESILEAAALVRGIDRNGPKQAIVRAVARACFDLGIDAVAGGVETPEEFRWFQGEGIRLFQGYLFSRPGFESLPTVNFPA